MSVHKAITKHVKNQNKIITDFVTLDQLREFYIEEAISLCEKGEAFSTDRINEVTQRINELSQQVNVPTRKIVTPDMVQAYVLKKSK